MIQGNLAGIRETILDELERLYDAEFDRGEFLPDRLLNSLVRYTTLINREMLVYLGRDGSVLEIAIGSVGSIALPELHLRRNPDRLSGFRCIHTHPGGNARLSDVDLQALRLLRFDAMCAVGVDNGICTGISAAFLGEMEYANLSVIIRGPVKPGRIPQQLWLREIEIAEDRVREAIAKGGIVEQTERVMLISIDDEASMDELASLVETAGGIVISRAFQNRVKPDPATYIGAGKAEELSLSCQAMEIDLAVVDDELSGAQQRNLEKELGVRVIDRTALILDIFAQRARSAEGKLQVELAQMKYLLPRLTGMGSVLSRLGGGIGTRGPGETKLETDRRHIRKRIDDLEKQLKEIERRRQLHRARREKEGRITVALVGYTNAGKSTLLNALTGSDVLVEDKLFATLDTTMRALEFQENNSCELVDTVGFIRKLPHALVQAFRSTLEEAVFADLIVIVSDISNPEYMQQRQTVFQVLNELGATDIPTLEVLNKADLVRSGTVIDPPGAILISAREGKGLETLKQAIKQKVAAMRHRVDILVPYDKGNVLPMLHREGQVLEEEYTGEGIRVVCMIDTAKYGRIKSLLADKRAD